MTSQRKLVQPQLAEPPELEVWGIDIEAQRGATWGDWAARMWFGAAWGPEGGDIEYTAPRAGARDFQRLLKALSMPGRLWVAHNGSYDLNGVSGESQRLGLGPMPAVLLHDTCKHTYGNGGFYSKALSSQCDHYGIAAKGHVTQATWEAAYRGERRALDFVREYNIDDVVCVLELRRAKLADGTLRSPRLWTP